MEHVCLAILVDIPLAVRHNVPPARQGQVNLYQGNLLAHPVTLDPMLGFFQPSAHLVKKANTNGHPQVVHALRVLRVPTRQTKVVLSAPSVRYSLIVECRHPPNAYPAKLDTLRD